MLKKHSCVAAWQNPSFLSRKNCLFSMRIHTDRDWKYLVLTFYCLPDVKNIMTGRADKEPPGYGALSLEHGVKSILIVAWWTNFKLVFHGDFYNVIFHITHFFKLSRFQCLAFSIFLPNSNGLITLVSKVMISSMHEAYMSNANNISWFSKRFYYNGQVFPMDFSAEYLYFLFSK